MQKKFTEIRIAGLKAGEHSFVFQLGEDFSDAFSNDFFSRPELSIHVSVHISDTLIKANLSMNGSVELVCDRSLDSFRMDLNQSATHFFKFGEEESELSDELEVIHPERTSIDFDQLIYDTVALSIPGKKLHPRFASESVTEEDGQLVYSTLPAESDEIKEDKRWEILRNFN